MTYGQQWRPPQPPPPPPPPPPAPRRYATGWLCFGLAVGLVTTIGIPLLGFFLATTVDQDAFGWVSSLAAFFPLVLGIVLTAMQGSPARRGFGLGMIIGWALSPIIFAGVCVLIIFGAYTIPGFRGGLA